ncbi:hypothetical protein DVH05_028148 [Phytophthora capsici]|nr:hypothetical protein DVH05_028148 [Phytophthora capsici]
MFISWPATLSLVIRERCSRWSSPHEAVTQLALRADPKTLSCSLSSLRQNPKPAPASPSLAHLYNWVLTPRATHTDLKRQHDVHLVACYGFAFARYSRALLAVVFS